MITLIVATDKNNLIGIDGKLPWKNKEDMKFFYSTTKESVVIMGRKTFESIGNPLPNRKSNIVISSNFFINEQFTQEFSKKYDLSNVVLESNFDNILKYNDSLENVYVIGGSSIYKECLDKNIVSRLLISRINLDITRNETSVYFPEIPKSFTLTQIFKLSNDVSVEDWRIG